MNLPQPSEYMSILENALKEDIGKGDVTTLSMELGDINAEAKMTTKEDGVISGLFIAEAVFKLVDPGICFDSLVEEGALVKSGTHIATIKGRAEAILAGERVALNFLQRMSGIATFTYRFVKAVKGTKATIKDTRKTTPGLRVLEKYAVRSAGGENHRFGLYDAVLLKDNHIEMAGGITEAVSRAKNRLGDSFVIEVETENLDQVREAVKSDADIIMLDNMSLSTIEEAVKIINGAAKVEVSGNVNLLNVDQYAAMGVDYISVGALTHSPDSLDISLNFSVSGLK